jgi:hypothetical protein
MLTPSSCSCCFSSAMSSSRSLRIYSSATGLVLCYKRAEKSEASLAFNTKPLLVSSLLFLLVTLLRRLLTLLLALLVFED